MHNSCESVEICSQAPPLAATHDVKRSSPSRSSRQTSSQERTAAQARAASALSEVRLQTAKISRLIAFPSPRVKRVEIRAARGLEHDTADARWVLKGVRFVCVRRWACVVCVLPVLTAELLLAWLVQCGFVPLERLLRRVRGRVVFDEDPAWSQLGTE